VGGVFVAVDRAEAESIAKSPDDLERVRELFPEAENHGRIEE